MNNISCYDRCSIENVREDTPFSLLLVFSLVLGVYRISVFPALSFADAILILSFIVLIIKYHVLELFPDKVLYVFLVYSIMITLFVAIIKNTDLSETITRLLGDGFYYICIFAFAYSFLNYKYFSKWVYRICVALGLYVVLQQIVFLSTDYLLPGFLMSATVTQTNTPIEIYQGTMSSAHRLGYLKANGFLLEGAHVAQALAIGFLVSYDFDNNDFKSIKRAMFFSVSSILSFSASAVFYIAFLWLVIMFRMMKSNRINKRISAILMVVLIGAVILALLSVSDRMLSVVGRLFSASNISTADHSSYMRLYKGYDYWTKIPLIYQIFGIGFGNYMSLTFLYNGTNFDIMNSEYMNSLSYLLISSGIIGIIMLVLVFTKLYRRSNLKGKIAILLLLLFCISSSVYSSIYWIWLVVVIMYNSIKKTSDLTAKLY